MKYNSTLEKFISTLFLASALLSSISLSGQTQIGNDIELSPSFSKTSGLAMNADGTRVAIGEEQYFENGERVGRILVYEWDGNTWNQMGNTIIGIQPSAEFGIELAMNDEGTVIFAGLPDADEYNTDAGLVYHFYYVANGDYWNFSTTGNFDFRTFEPYAHLGRAIAIGGSPQRVLVGANGMQAFPNIQTDTRHGGIQLYEIQPDNTYERLLNADFSEVVGDNQSDQMGVDVDISDDGQRFAVGSFRYVKIMRFDPDPVNPLFGEFVTEATIENPSTQFNFGHSISLAGNGQRITIGSDRGGLIYTFDFDGINWVSSATTLDLNTDIRSFDHSIRHEMTSDGNTLIVGAYNRSIDVIGRLIRYTYENGDWIEEDMSSPLLDNSGFKVAISDDASIVATQFITSSERNYTRVMDFGSVVLPISLSAFQARHTGKSVLLTWQTTSEENTEKFALERSVDGGRTFQLIGAVAARNSEAGAAYLYLDEQVDGLVGRQLYYRLRAQDYDGANQVFGPVMVALSPNAGSDLKVFPNPLSAGEAINIQGGAAGAKVELRAMDGRLLASLRPTTGNSYPLPELAAGVYIVRA
ncbi:MAG: T9SS type A sorting domain-containing protein, partial [Lewinella sp.]